MKIENRNVAGLLRGLPGDDFRALLLYGEVNSSLGQRYSEILELFRSRKYEVVHLTSDDLKGNEGALAERFTANSMFFSNTLFVLKLLANASLFTKHLERLLGDVDLDNNENFLLVTTGPLEVSSSLRKYAEKSEQLACIACYGETPAELSNFVRKKLKEHNLKVAPGVLDYIVRLGGSSTALENEIWKLDLYGDEEERTISLEDAQNCLVDTSTSDIDDFLGHFCSGDKMETLAALQRIYEEDTEPIVLLRSMIRHFLLLQRIRCQLEGGKSLEEIFRTERIFWKSQISLEHYVKNWSAEGINSLLEQLITAEKNVKFSSWDPQLELENFLLRLLI